MYKWWWRCEDSKQRERGVASGGDPGTKVTWKCRAVYKVGCVLWSPLRRQSCLWSALGDKRDTFTNENLLYKRSALRAACKGKCYSQSEVTKLSSSGFKVFMFLHRFSFLLLLVTLKTVFLFLKIVFALTSHLPVLQLKYYIFMTIKFYHVYESCAWEIKKQ